MTCRVGCQKATTELSLRNSQSLSHLRYPTDTRQLTSPQGEADGVSDGGMTLQALGGVNSPCDWYRVRGQPPSTGGQEHTHTHMQVEEQEKLLLHEKSLKSWPGKMKFIVARVQPGLALCTYHKVKLSIVFSKHGHQV